MMPKFDEFLLICTYFFLKGWKIILPAIVIGFVAFGYYLGAA